MQAVPLIGCSGWQYASWRERFYPPGLPQSQWLSHYAAEFEVVEVNATFYRLPKQEAVARWLEQVPEHFRFSIKGSKFVTQNKKLLDFGEHAPLLMERIEPLLGTPRMGPILWQLPEGWPLHLDRLRDALSSLPPGAQYAFEFRHESWFCDDVYEALREHGVALVVGDHHERPYQAWLRTTPWTFVRMHHSADNAGGRYSDRELERLAGWLRAIDDPGAEAWVFFNNDWEGYAIDNARTLKRMLGVGDAGPPSAGHVPAGGSAGSSCSR